MQSLSGVSVQFVKGVGPAKKKLFANLGIETVEDLFYFFPRRHEDRRQMTPIAQIPIGESRTIAGEVVSVCARRSWHTKKHLTEVVLDDGTARMTCVWFNQPYLNKYFQKGRRAVCFGKADIFKKRLQMVSPEYEIIEEQTDNLSINRIVPVYPLTRGMTQRFIRKVVTAAFDKYKDGLVDELPVALRNKLRLSNIKRSIGAIHFPQDFEEQQKAMRRISFEEFFFFQIAVTLRRLSITGKKGISHIISDLQTMNFINGFPFELTAAQKKTIREIKKDMMCPKPMLRLLQGDVGSGKTLVSLFGCLAAFENGHQSAIMAPTEILARQHYENVLKLTENGPLKGIKVAFLFSGLKAKERRAVLEDIQSGRVNLIIGTHALISEDIRFKSLSYVVIDEQHKFGVRQRALLTEKGQNPDVLIMTATPIPRTLCITLYGDLDVSIINEMPPGRGEIKTKLFGHEEAEKVYAFVKKKVQEGRQAYIVYPVIEENEDSDLKSAEQMYKLFKKGVFKDLRLGLVHSQMKARDTQKIMRSFKEGGLDVLVATTVLEVGVDVANATVMVIENAERFGLAQLHQLRGRIGRGKHDSYCLLTADSLTEDGRKRLDAVVKTRDGFEIARQDLLIRGPGHYFGRHQHGLNELKVANPATQIDLLELAREEAVSMIDEDKKLELPQNQILKRIVKRRYPGYLEMVKAG